MNITRRAALLGGLSVPLLAMANKGASLPATAEILPNPVIVTISGADAGADPVRLATLMDPFLIRKVPVLLSIAPFGVDGRPLDHDSALAVFLRKSLRLHADCLEIGIHADTVSSADPYFQLRQISEAQAAFSKVINEYESYRFKAIVTAMTVTTNSPLRSFQDCSAMRAAGIRSVIHLPAGLEDAARLQPVDGGYWTTGTGLVNTFGLPQSTTRPAPGTSTPLEIPTLAANIEALTATTNPIIVDIPVGPLTGMSERDLAGYATDVAQVILKAATSGLVRGILPNTLYMQSRGEQSRFVIIRVDDLRISPSSDVSQMAFIYDLIEAGYPVTEAIIPSPSGNLFSRDERSKAYVRAMLADKRYDIATHGWEHKPSELQGNSVERNFDLIRNGVAEVFRSTGRLPVSYIPPNDAFDENTLDALAATGTPLFSAEKGDFRWFSGLDRRGLLHVSNTIMFEQAWNADIPYFETDQVLDFFGSRNDAVFSIHPFTATTPERKQRVKDTLEALSRQRGTQLVNFDEYCRAVTPAMPNAELIRGARADVVIRDWRPDAQTVEMENALKADAALAWSYFDWGARNFNGMVPGTCWIEYGERKGYPFTTMWDVGTYIMAAICAHRLEMIDQQKFEATVSRILAFLGESSFRHAGVKLPHAERPLGQQGGQREGFDSADTGRMLIALKILDHHTASSLAIDKLVARWGFEAVLEDGEMHVVSNGRASSAHSNSYAGYVGRGYSLWGHSIKPVFETKNPGREMDDAVRALAEIRRRGRIATEPHITEEIELGGSPHGRLMADILYAAQMKRYRKTGTLTCVSEGPVTGAPYFTYQGYQLDDNGGRFVVDAPTTAKAAEAAARGDALRMISSKAAYLWYAGRPGDYSNMLVSLVREQAKMPGIGFASGVSELTGKRIEVSDLNTNGIILEAIAYILCGRKPFLPLEATSAI